MTDLLLPDAAPTNWVDRHAPAALRPWLKLGRFDRPAGIWLLMLPGWMGIALADASRGDWPNPVLLILFFVGAALMRAAGCAFNDIVDRDFDAQVARTAMRPIPSGQISVKQAWGFLVGCALIGLAILLSMNLWAVLLGVGSLALVAAYPFMKRITWWPQAWLGMTFNWGALLGYAAAMDPRSVFTQLLSGDPATAQAISFWPAVVLWTAGIFWTLGYDTIYAVQDLEDDALAGVKSSARRLGEHTRRGVLGFYIAAFLLAVAAAWLAGLGPMFLPFAALFMAHTSWQAARLKLDNPAAALALFKSNITAGALLVAAMVAGMWRPGGF